MIREFNYKGEIFRVNYHGAPGHEEVFIMHLIDGEEFGEMSIDRMTEENDTDAPIEQICIDLREKLIPEREIDCADPAAGFRDTGVSAWPTPVSLFLKCFFKNFQDAL